MEFVMMSLSFPLPETAYAHLFITVRDVNDNAPQFDYPFYIFGEQCMAVITLHAASLTVVHMASAVVVATVL